MGGTPDGVIDGSRSPVGGLGETFELYVFTK